MDLLKDKRQKNWFYVENLIMDTTELTIFEKMVYMVLARHANEGSTCFPSQKTIAEKAGCSKSQVIRAIKSLEEKCLIKKETRTKKNSKEKDSNIYTIMSVENLFKSQDTGSVCEEAPSVCEEVPSVCETPQVVSGRNSNNTKLNNTNITKKNNKKTFDVNSDEYRLAKLLFEYIQKKDPTANKPNFQEWSRIFNDLIEEKGRTPKQIKEIIDWAQNSTFWFPHTTTPAKIKAKFGTLVLQKLAEERKKTSKQVEVIDDLAGFKRY